MIGSPVRDSNDKYYMSQSMFPGSKLPKYCSGAGYALSYNALECYIKRVSSTNFVSNEDVATGLIMQACSILITPSNRVFLSAPQKGWAILHRADILQTHSTIRDSMFRHNIDSDISHEILISTTSRFNCVKRNVESCREQGHWNFIRIGDDGPRDESLSYRSFCLKYNCV